MQDKILELIFEKDDVTWQSLIYDLVRTEKMNPWDIDISQIAQKYIDMVRNLKKLDFRLSGKIILAAAVLLKIKSHRLVTSDIDRLDSLFVEDEESGDGLLDDEAFEKERTVLGEDAKRLIPRTPQPRKRKVSVYDLINALQKAMEVKKRKVMRELPPLEMEVEAKRTKDISLLLRDVYKKIKMFFWRNSGKRLTFNQLVPEPASKENKVYTFIPLLHLTNQRRIDLMQEQHFGDIEVSLLKKELKKELPELKSSPESP